MKKSEATRARLLAAAKEVVRRRGYDQAGMREIAEQAGLSLGAAYYYFRTKEELVLAYYEELQRQDAARSLAIQGGPGDLRARLDALLQGKLDLLAQDRELLGILLRHLVDPRDRLGLFAKETAGLRSESVQLFRRMLDPEPLSDEIKDVAAEGLWLLHLGLAWHLLGDDSPGQARTRALLGRVLDLAVLLLHTQGAALLTFAGMVRAILVVEPGQGGAAGREGGGSQ